MPNKLVIKSSVLEQQELNSAAPKSQRIKSVKSEDGENNKSLPKRPRDMEVSLPLVYGNAAFWLGKKANEYQSHRWTVYVRGAANEDLGAVVKQVVFQLHSSFNNPTRVVESPPFELSEAGWGEFEIAITLHFHNDVCDKPLSLELGASPTDSEARCAVWAVDRYHHLKLYPEDESGSMSTKKPVVVESFEDIVFYDPSDSFLARIQSHPSVIVPRLPPGFTLPPPVPAEDPNKKKRGDTKDHPLSQWFTNFSEADELLQLAAARQQVQAHTAKLKRQLGTLGEHNQPLEPTAQQ